MCISRLTVCLQSGGIVVIAILLVMYSFRLICCMMKAIVKKVLNISLCRTKYCLCSSST
jgi:hypothetical protein